MSGVWDRAGLWWRDERRGGEGEGKTGAMGRDGRVSLLTLVFGFLRSGR